jgi:hypothetical protein
MPAPPTDSIATPAPVSKPPPRINFRLWGCLAGTGCAVLLIATTAISIGLVLLMRLTTPTSSATCEDLRVSILLVESDQQGLVIFLLMENVSSSRKIEFIQYRYGVALPELRFTDDFGKRYHSTPTDDRLWVPAVELRPNDFIILPLACQPLLDSATELNLTFLSPAINSGGVFRIRIPLKAETISYTRPVVNRFNPQLSFLPRDPPQSTHVTGTVLFKRDDFEVWFSKWNSKFEKK